MNETLATVLRTFKRDDNSPNMHMRNESNPLLLSGTRPITQEQLVNEVKGIYADLPKVEEKCVEISHTPMSSANIAEEQWQALVAPRCTSVHEHQGFLLLYHRPKAPRAFRLYPSARTSSNNYSRSLDTSNRFALPAQMWWHGIHALLECLRHGLPDGLDHMLAFIYLSHSMIALLKETVVGFVETWIECLGDLARYSTAIRKVNLRPVDTLRECISDLTRYQRPVDNLHADGGKTWFGVAPMWYDKAVKKTPIINIIRHHLSVSAGPNSRRRRYCYAIAGIALTPLQNAGKAVTAFLEHLKVSAAITRIHRSGTIFIGTHSICPARQSSLMYRRQFGFFRLIDQWNLRVASWWKGRPLNQSESDQNDPRESFLSTTAGKYLNDAQREDVQGSQSRGKSALNFGMEYGGHSNSFPFLPRILQNGISTLFLLFANLPITCATDVEHSSPTPSLSGSITRFHNVLEWALAIFTVVCIAWLSSLKSTKDPLMAFCTLSGVLALGIAAVFCDVRTAPVILYPALALECFFLVRYWQDSFKTHQSMGNGCKFLIPGLGVSFDCIIVQFASASNSPGNTNNQDSLAQATFAQFLPFGIWLSLSIVSYAAALLGRVRIVPLSEEHPLDELPRFERNNWSWGAESIPAGE